MNRKVYSVNKIFVKRVFGCAVCVDTFRADYWRNWWRTRIRAEVCTEMCTEVWTEQNLLTRKKIADKLGLPSPLSKQELEKTYRSAASTHYAYVNAENNLFDVASTSLVLTTGSVALFKLTPTPRTPRQFFWFRGPAVVLGACAATALAIIPLSLYPTYAQLERRKRATIGGLRYWNWKE